MFREIVKNIVEKFGIPTVVDMHNHFGIGKYRLYGVVARIDQPCKILTVFNFSQRIEHASAGFVAYLNPVDGNALRFQAAKHVARMVVDSRAEFLYVVGCPNFRGELFRRVGP